MNPGLDAIGGLVLVAVAVVSKIIGSGLGAWWGGLRRPEALRLGIGMVSRGEVGLIDNVAFAQIVLVVLATTLVSPLMLRWVYAPADRPAADTRPKHAAANGE